MIPFMDMSSRPPPPSMAVVWFCRWWSPRLCVHCHLCWCWQMLAESSEKRNRSRTVPCLVPLVQTTRHVSRPHTSRTVAEIDQDPRCEMQAHSGATFGWLVRPCVTVQICWMFSSPTPPMLLRCSWSCISLLSLCSLIFLLSSLCTAFTSFLFPDLKALFSP